MIIIFSEVLSLMVGLCILATQYVQQNIPYIKSKLKKILIIGLILSPLNVVIIPSIMLYFLYLFVDGIINDVIKPLLQEKE